MITTTAWRKKASPLFALALSVFCSTQAGETNAPLLIKIGASEATNHYGETLIVTGIVAQVSARPRMAFINLDRPYPDSPFVAVAFNYTNKFTNLPSLKGKNIELSGMITNYRGRPEIVITNASQLTVTTPAK
jgi:DNA/RNA endonuclease YhcR with UshA esterase domain